MGLFEQLPYTNFHDLNLTEIVKRINELAHEMHEFKVVNKISYRGDWDITKQYPAWSVVAVNGVTGYISIKPVPYGVDIANTEYWVLIADFSVQLAGLGARVDDLENDMLTVQGNITTINGTLANVVAIINSNHLRVYDSCVWIGDSYTSAGSLGADVDKRFSTKVSNYLGLTEHNYAVGGTGFCYGSTPYPTQVANAVADFNNNNLDETKVKYCFIMGNRNDADGTYSWSQMATAVQSVITTLSNFFVNAKLVIIPAMWDAKPAKLQMIRYASIVNEVSQGYNNVLYIDNAWTWLTGHEDKILYQGGADVHPNVSGHQILTSHIINALEGSNYTCARNYEFIPASLHSDVTSCYCAIRIINDKAYFQCKFKVSNGVFSGNIFSDVIGNLSLSNVFITNQPVYCRVMTEHSQSGYAMVTVNQTLTKTDDVTGSLTTNAYIYSGSGTFFDTNGWNWIEFEIPYGLQRVTYDN